jgi:hypothetical protein
MEIKICIDINEYDLAFLLQLARMKKIPLDVLVKQALAEYVEKSLSSPIPQVNPTTGGEK